MATKGYQTYRGRMPRWKKALMAVLVLILIGACAFLVLQNTRCLMPTEFICK